MIRKKVRKILHQYSIYRDRARIYKFYRNQFKRYCEMQGIENKELDGEREYKKKWEVFRSPVEPFSYRLFSRYMGNSVDIVPENIGRSYIEPLLNPRRFLDYYQDKNIYDRMFGDDILPETIIRRMGGVFLNKDYRPILWGGGIKAMLSSSYERIILKPSIDSDSGRGVMLFLKNNGKFISVKEVQELTLDYLMKYGDDFILQEALKQHELLERFNTTSVNTMRIAVYRSVKDETINITGALVRVGRSGEICDNAHMGGFFVGINPENGHLNYYACDQYGNRTPKWNNVDYKANDFVIPNWDKVIEFAKYICSKLLHCRLVQLDIALDVNGNPRLIEYNIRSFSYWLFMYSGQKPFGKFTDEIITYCCDKMKRLNR